jgi:hypothetical protein
MRFPYDRAMDRMTIIAGGFALVIATAASANGTPAIVHSSKAQADVVACLADQIREFDNPTVAPGADGVMRVTTHFLHVTRIDITVTPSPVRIAVKNRIKGKLKRIVEGCS